MWLLFNVFLKCLLYGGIETFEIFLPGRSEMPRVEDVAFLPFNSSRENVQIPAYAVDHLQASLIHHIF